MNILCPVCKKELLRGEKTFFCAAGHSFDIAKEGYVNLSRHNSKNTGDNPEMIRARRSFLEKGHYGFLKDRINGLLKKDEELADLACGEGYYTADLKARERIGIDLSRQGLRYASRKDKKTTYILASIFHTPLADECADTVTTIFAPVAGQEIRRILKDRGRFILVRPDERHLFELKEKIYEKPYLNETEAIKIEGLVLEKRLQIADEAVLDKQELSDLFLMTPYSNTTSSADKEKIFALEQLKTGFCFIIDIYRKDS